MKTYKNLTSIKTSAGHYKVTNTDTNESKTFTNVDLIEATFDDDYDYLELNNYQDRDEAYWTIIYLLDI